MRTELTKVIIISRDELATILGMNSNDSFTNVEWTGGDGANLKITVKSPKEDSRVNP
jgi:hypothetical protein